MQYFSVKLTFKIKFKKTILQIIILNIKNTFLKKYFIYLFMRDTQREAET